MKSSSLAGVLPVFQTPYHDDESIDFDTLTREIDWLFERGADGIVMAMVSETLRLSGDERQQLAEHACRQGRDHGAVVISVGAESSRTAEHYSRHAAGCGASALMAIPPVATAAGEAEVMRYYERLVRAVEIPLIVQDASGYVGRPMPIELQARLLNEFGERILFKPEATPIGPRLTALLEATGGRARIFEGSGGIALVESHARGIVGTMPGAEMIEGIVALWQALENGDRTTVDRIFPIICVLVSLQTGLDGFLAIEKYLLVKQGLFRNTLVRGPVAYQLDQQTRMQVDYWFARLQESL